VIAGAAALRRRVRLAGRLLALPVTLTAPISAQRLFAVGSQAAAGFVLCTEPLTNERLCLLCHQRGGPRKIAGMSWLQAEDYLKSVCAEFLRDHANVPIKWHAGWNAPRVWPG